MTQSQPADLREQVSSAPRRPAQIIRSDAEAIEVAQRLAEDFAREAAWRDRERRLPWEELDRFSESGLWAISVPKAHGGAGVSYVTLSEVIATISAADSSLGQLPQNHFGVLSNLGLTGSEAEVAAVASHFKVVAQRQPAADGGYTVDHSAGSYLFDRDGKLRVYLPYATPASDIAHDVKALLG